MRNTFIFLVWSMLSVNGFLFSQHQPQIIALDQQDLIDFSPKEFFFWKNSNDLHLSLNKNTLDTLDFQQLNGKIPNFGFFQHDVWFHFSVTNPSEHQQIIYFSLSNPNLDEAQLISFTDHGHIRKMKTLSDLKTFKDRPINSRKLIFPLVVQKDDTIEYYLKVNNGGEQFHFTPTLISPKQFATQDAQENYFLGIYFGILLFVILFNVFMWVITKETLSFHYSFYLITFLFLQCSLLGYGKVFIWPTNSYLSNHANPFFASSSVFFLLRFSRYYLNLNVVLPRWDKILQFLQLPILLCTLLSLIPQKDCYMLSVLFVNGFTLVLNVLILPIAITAIRRGFQPARLFLIAFSLLIISVFAFVLKNFGILPSNYFTDYGFQFGSTAEVILFSLGIVIRFKNFREEAINRLQEINLLKEEANVVLEKKVQERTLEIEVQKQEIEYKNAEIISSISYAKRIQEAILPTSEKLSHLLPTSHLWYAPKDIVAGDFYFAEQRHFHGKDFTFFAVGDCTGHGVPGAMMSVLCTNALLSSLNLQTSPGTGEVLENCNALLIESIGRHSDEINDGMDISICCLDEETNELRWSGANNPLWILRKNELIEYQGTKRPIGKSSTTIPFEEHVIQLEENDRLFLFTDGIIDQFGGDEGKKFKKSRLREILLSSSHLPAKDQLNFVKETLKNWMGNSEQIDDIAFLLVTRD